MKRLLLSVVAMAIYATATCEEGMWLPSIIGQTKLLDMQKTGLKLSAEDLYSVTQPSLKDAIVNIGGCTGELVSAEGLLITNHHCGYGQIQFHSSEDKDFLTNGFAAMNRSEELPCKDYSAKFLVRADDVTDRVLSSLKEGVTGKERSDAIAEITKQIVKEATENTHYEASVEAMYHSNQYFLFVYEKFSDIRLVVAPPSAVGKFGGDTDNWMWPRHTGDFTMFRIYADKDGKPAPYSVDNKPLRPKRFFKIDTRGAKEGDFTMVYGYPGRTNQYLHSSAVEYIAMKSNPAKIALRTQRLNVMNAHQDKSVKVRIQYAAKNASVANAWKKWQGEERGIKRLDVISKKRKYEKEFIQWAQGKEYADVISSLEKLYSQIEPYALASDYYSEAFRAIELTRFASRLALAANKSEEALQKELKEAEFFYKDYSKEIDNEIAHLMMKSYYKNIDANYLPQIGDSDNYVATLFSTSRLCDAAFIEGLKSMSYEQQKEALNNDAAITAYKLFNDKYKECVESQYKDLNSQITLLYQKYMKGMMEHQSDRIFYPDANSTLRIAYGTIAGFNPRDGVSYKPYTTLDGVIAKDNPEIYDYDVPQKLRQLHDSKDYGQWEVDGSVPVAFIASNHTTGGNSGSPVVSSEGYLLGTNFDRCWESTMSDIVYDRDMCRNIAVDVRYVLFLTEKLCGAGYLFDEMEFVR